MFEKNGKNFVFEKQGSRFERRDVNVEQRTESRLVISGLAEGTEVALVDPTATTKAAPTSSAPALPSGGPK